MKALHLCPLVCFNNRGVKTSLVWNVLETAVDLRLKQVKMQLDAVWLYYRVIDGAGAVFWSTPIDSVLLALSQPP